MPLAAILGCAGPDLTAAERDFFRSADPLGFILFARNLVDPDQVRRLCADLRASIGRADAPILIDQEGGRVARLRPPHWRHPPAAERFGLLAAADRARAAQAVRVNHALMAAELRDIGLNVDCAPMVDVRAPGAHDIIGDRAFGTDPYLVADLGRAAAEGLLSGGVMPVIKHIPGHGRSMVDSHHDLPRVETDFDTLAETDFVPFRALNDIPWAMTAHIVYSAIDPMQPATLSPTVIAEVIRGEIGFAGLLVSDDLSMKALRGGLDELAAASLAAGCDVVLHCNGDMAEMEQVVRGARPLSPAGEARYEQGQRRLNPEPDQDRAEMLDELSSLLA
ncbi:beta-N-acetylhexosaminidase [Dongia mobilis]|uniref:beta-N-acetylhexosaminidase n=1 Tax=Dongia mobilis TaxID=578943 RepID=A0A4R6WQ73_9PROT|nr:beta-N-acetylhexosaminidase [Dongia mobilis]TDQ80423.1 beta-N-acetylhexosaminidase [Dongia mobilis]